MASVTILPTTMYGHEIRHTLSSATMTLRKLAWRKPIPRETAWPVTVIDGRQWIEAPWQRLKPGDLLWVREQWLPHVGRTHYGATETMAQVHAAHQKPPTVGWRSPKAMQQHHSRMTLEVVTSAMGHAQDVTADDAVAMGYSGLSEFEQAWNDAKRLDLTDTAGTLWKDNPAVVVLACKVHKSNIHAVLKGMKNG